MESSPQYTSEAFIPVPAFSKNSSDGLKRRNDGHKINIKVENKRLMKESSNSAEIYPPWRKTAAYSCGVIGLHEEINDFYDVMRPTEAEAEVRLKVVEHITRIVHSLWPQAKVEVFGSFRTGLYLPSSDIDMVVIGEWRSIPLSTLSNALEKNGIQNSDIEIIASATVPIVRLVHTPSRIRVDISFNMRNGVKGAKLIKKLMKEYPVLPKLVFVLKQFLVHRGLNEVYNGGMSSYCLTLLIVSLLQGHHKPKNLPSLNLGTLLLEFLEHYGINFNYEKVSIHLQAGGSYRPRFGIGNYLSVEDPLVEGHDVAKGTFLMPQLRTSFQNAYHLLSQIVLGSADREAPQSSFLCRIFQVDDEALSSREWLSENYVSISGRLNHLLANINGNHSSEPLAKVMKDSLQIRKAKRKKF